MCGCTRQGLKIIPWTELSPRHARGYSKKLIKPSHWRTSLKGNWFAIRCIDPWNSLPNEVVSAPSIATFKKRYDLYVAKENNP